jgi:hypothetical protein
MTKPQFLYRTVWQAHGFVTAFTFRRRSHYRNGLHDGVDGFGRKYAESTICKAITTEGLTNERLKKDIKTLSRGYKIIFSIDKMLIPLNVKSAYFEASTHFYYLYGR